MHVKGKGAFTLIELLIVVAIIAILAAIAVPNFLEAQTRSKVSRAQADLRTIATALESYRVDNAAYPFDLDSRGWAWYLTDVLSTPISYLTNASLMQDPFRRSWRGREEPDRYRYINYPANMGGARAWAPSPYPGPYTFRWVTVDDSFVRQGMRLYGEWLISSAGPDEVPSAGGFIAGDIIYDPSNGTISEGDIIRSQRTGQRTN